MIHKRELQQTVGTALRAAGFTKKGRLWILEGRDTIVELYTEKKDYENVYRICMSIWIRELRSSDDPFPKTPHLNLSLAGVLSGDQEAIRKACSLDLADQADLSRLREILETHFAPMAQELATIDGVKKHFHTGKLKGGLLRGEARALLGG